MSSVLHPVGPEPPRTYWLRRVLVAAASVLVVVLLIAVIVSATKADPAIASGPSPQPTVAGGPPATGEPTEAQFTPASGPTSTTATSTAKPDTQKPSSQKPTTKPTTPAPTTCDPATLRTTLTGKQTLKVKKPNTFTLSLINGGSAACTVHVTAKTFELKIYSGSDRIWSTADCATSVKPITKRVASEAAVEWQLTWSGRRSLKECKQRAEIPRSGTYVVTAELSGAKPVQLRMILRA